MIKRLVRLFIAILVAFIIRSPDSTNAAVYWWPEGVHSNIVSVCFVGTAITTRPNRVQQILSTLKLFEHAANIQFNYLGACPPPIIRNGLPYHDGDIRVLINNVGIPWGTQDVPPKECPTTGQSGGSWSDGPNSLEPLRACLYNLKLGDDSGRDGIPYVNTTLHEFGHALGLDHEHIRPDGNAGCTENGYGPNLPADNHDRVRAGENSMTGYDRDSVMHYKLDSCGIDGNYAHTGLSDFDKLALHILYPEGNRVAEFIGSTVVRTTDTLNLQSAWMVKGANIDYVAKNFNWKIDGKIVSKTPTLVMGINTPGNYSLEFSYSDFFDRDYTCYPTFDIK